MTHDQYSAHVKQFTDEMKEVTLAKNADYCAGTDDSMHDYHAAAVESAITPMQAWSVFMMKHVRAIQRYIKTGSVSSEAIQGRFIDLANYAMLGSALVNDLEAKKSTPPQDGLVGGHGEDL